MFVFYLVAKWDSDLEANDFKLCDDPFKNKGPWHEVNQAIIHAETFINDRLISRADELFNIRPVDLSDNASLSLNEEFEKFYSHLDMVDEDHETLAQQIKQSCEEYVKKTLVPKLLRLEMIILLQAFNIKGKPIIDLFYTFKNCVRVLREPLEFCFIMGGGFMALFYKVLLLVFNINFVETNRSTVSLYYFD